MVQHHQEGDVGNGVHCQAFLPLPVWVRPVTVRTDHNALKWLQSFKEPKGQVARWLETLARYDYMIEHRPGKNHQNVDALSRNPLPVAVPDQAVETYTVDSSDRA